MEQVKQGMQVDTEENQETEWSYQSKHRLYKRSASDSSGREERASLSGEQVSNIWRQEGEAGR